ncbi:hypothetical protein MYCTH_2109166 [Thermothelomyces thermophilus ATCC 42464]|uniref:Uncharacterized protein n=1 Tax=Thermothelomyces thermophilus (strain ATCC 42464 / BCRC 31852 / DSM 1799) TaxID=573729 RepID=G2QAC5_THET4|nr:uncharacterized protein MYCTH_2109166 [Thermothelomyces thermophilus ATCC 42464]AEO56675.1 hypothetical protein MYCTH_2109166 [Thermothelomyces thermophilus ATCC 42464]
MDFRRGARGRRYPRPEFYRCLGSFELLRDMSANDRPGFGHTSSQTAVTQVSASARSGWFEARNDGRAKQGFDGNLLGCPQEQNHSRSIVQMREKRPRSFKEALPVSGIQCSSIIALYVVLDGRVVVKRGAADARSRVDALTEGRARDVAKSREALEPGPRTPNQQNHPVRTLFRASASPPPPHPFISASPAAPPVNTWGLTPSSFDCPFR